MSGRTAFSSLVALSIVIAVDTEASAGEWSWQNPLAEEGPTLRSLWCSGPHDVFAAGELGTLLHYNGLSWSAMTSGTSQLLLSLWGSGPDDVFAVGTSGTIVHYDGSNWSVMASGTTRTLYGVWGSGPSDVFAVGDETILHYNGTGWSYLAASARLYGIWGSGPNDVYAVGEDGAMVHYDGSVWVAVGSGTTDDLKGVWGSGPNDIFVAASANGYHGHVLHFNGTDWSEMYTIDPGEFVDVWGSGPNDVFAVPQWSSYHGTLFHYDGTTWSPTSLGTAALLFSVCGSGADDVFAVGEVGKIMHYDGSVWWTVSSLPPPPPVTGYGLTGIWGSGYGDLFAVGGAGTIIHNDGTTWSQMTSGCSQGLRAIWGSGPNVVFAVGNNGTLLGYDGSNWSTMSSGTSNALYDVWCSGPNDVYVVALGEYGITGTLRHYDGSSWTTVSAVDPAFSVWGSGPNDVYAGSTVFHDSPYPWEEYWQGAVYHYDGSTWTHVATAGRSESLFRLPITTIWGSSPNDVFAGGGVPNPSSSLMLHYNGTSWSSMNCGAGDQIDSIWGSGPSDVYVVDGWDTVRHYDGSGWSGMVTGAGCLWGVWGNGSDDVFAVGSGGTILHRPAQYRLTLTVPHMSWGQVTVVPNLPYYDADSPVMLIAEPEVGYDFAWWEGDVPPGHELDNPLTMNMDSDKSITAVFGGIHTLAVTVVDPAWGIVDVQPDLPSYPDGAEVTLEAVANEYRNFVNWEGDVPGGHSTENPLTITMDSNRAITAVFEWPNYTLSLNVVNDLWGTVDVEPYAPGYEYAAGTEVALNAVPIGGNDFEHWKIYDPNHPGDPNYAATDSNNPITVVMGADREITAVFTCGSSVAPLLPMVLVVLVLCLWVRRRA